MHVFCNLSCRMSEIKTKCISYGDLHSWYVLCDKVTKWRLLVHKCKYISVGVKYRQYICLYVVFGRYVCLVIIIDITTAILLLSTGVKC